MNCWTTRSIQQTMQTLVLGECLSELYIYIYISQNNPSRVLSTPTGTRGIFLSQMRSLRYERHASGGIHASLQHSLYFLLSKISEVLGLLSALSNRMRMRGSQASLEDSARTGARNQLSSAQLAMGCFQLKAKEKKAQILKLTAR